MKKFLLICTIVSIPVIAFAAELPDDDTVREQAQQRVSKDGIDQRLEFIDKELARIEKQLAYLTRVKDITSVAEQIQLLVDRNASLEKAKILLTKITSIFELADSASSQNRSAVSTRLRELLNQNILNQEQFDTMNGRIDNPELFNVGFSLFCDAALERHQEGMPTYNRQDLDFSHQSLILPHELNEFQLNRLRERVQLKVKDQGDRDGGGAASCAFHALKNVLIMARLVKSSPTQRSMLLYELQSAQLIRTLFGHEEAQWRSCVIDLRKRRWVQNFIEDILWLRLHDAQTLDEAEPGCKKLSCFDLFVKTAAVQSTHESYQLTTFFSVIAKKLAYSVCDRLLHEDFYQITLGDLQPLFEEVLQLKIDKGEADVVHKLNELLDHFGERINDQTRQEILTVGALQERVTRLRQLFAHWQDSFEASQARDIQLGLDTAQETTTIRERQLRLQPVLTQTINRWMPELKNIKITVGREHLEESSTTSYFDPKSFRTKLSVYPGSNFGEWLQNEEIIPLLEFEQRHGSLLSGIGDLPIIFLGDASNDDSSRSLREQLYTDDDGFCLKPEFDALVTIVRNPQSRHVALIILRTQAAHWIAVVVNKIGNQIQYLIADSCNVSRVKDPRVIELIELLEGRELDNSSCWVQ